MECPIVVLNVCLFCKFESFVENFVFLFIYNSIRIRGIFWCVECSMYLGVCGFLLLLKMFILCFSVVSLPYSLALLTSIIQY